MRLKAMHRVAALALAGLLFPVQSAFAQAGGDLNGQPANPTFEVASVRANTTGELRFDLRVLPERLIATNVPLELLITRAYGIHAGQLGNARGWLDERFDVQATAPRPTSRDEMLVMLQLLLAERFRLQVHRENREMDTYALERADLDGAPSTALHPVLVDCETNRLAEGSGPGLFPPDARPRCGSLLIGMSLQPGPVLYEHRYAAYSMKEFAATLWGSLGRPVVDRTGLAGTYDIELEYLGESRVPTGAFPELSPEDREPPVGPTRIDALRDQLGLRLRTERNEIEFLVIDSIERPRPDEN